MAFSPANNDYLASLAARLGDPIGNVFRRSFSDPLPPAVRIEASFSAWPSRVPKVILSTGDVCTARGGWLLRDEPDVTPATDTTHEVRDFPRYHDPRTRYEAVHLDGNIVWFDSDGVECLRESCRLNSFMVPPDCRD